MRTRFDHVGLSVADLEAAERFYSSAFGFTRQLVFELSPPPIRGMMLTPPSGCWFELFEHAASAPGPEATGPIEAHATRGYNHFALAAPDSRHDDDAPIGMPVRAVRTCGIGPRARGQRADRGARDAGL